MSAAFAYTPPPKETPATLRDVISVKTALATLLAEEADFMDTMQLAKVGELQDRKLKLIGLLERYMRYLSLHKDVVLATSAAEKAELQATADIFHKAMKRNYDTLLVARAVNGAVVKCVTEIVARKDNNPIYNDRGVTGHPTYLPVSVTLNQTI